MPLGAFRSALMGVAGVSSGELFLVDSQTGTGVTEMDFTMDGSYREFIFKFYNLNPTTDNTALVFQINATDGADYDDSPITTTYFEAYHQRGDASAGMAYSLNQDSNVNTSWVTICHQLGNDTDEQSNGEFRITNPSSSVFATTFSSRFVTDQYNDYFEDNTCAGYVDDVTPLDDIRFKMSSGAFDGTITMWGIK